MIRFDCTYCNVKIAVQPESAGKSITCHQCEKRLRVPKPKAAAVVEDDDLLYAVEVVDDDDDVPVAIPVAEAQKSPKRKRRDEKQEKRERGLVAHGNNGSVELVGTELIFDHEGWFGGHWGTIRAGKYRHSVLGLTEIEYVAPSFLSEGRLRFVFGNERVDADVEYTLDTQTITFNCADGPRFLRFKKEVERFKRQLINDIRMSK